MEEAFNIKIDYEGGEVTSTILRQVGYYKVIYFGGIMGGIRLTDGKWELIDPEKMEAGDYRSICQTRKEKGSRLS